MAYTVTGTVTYTAQGTQAYEVTRQNIVDGAGHQVPSARHIAESRTKQSSYLPVSATTELHCPRVGSTTRKPAASWESGASSVCLCIICVGKSICD